VLCDLSQSISQARHGFSPANELIIVTTGRRPRGNTPHGTNQYVNVRTPSFQCMPHDTEVVVSTRSNDLHKWVQPPQFVEVGRFRLHWHHHDRHLTATNTRPQGTAIDRWVELFT
jgi:hypothetical protein